MLEGLMKRLYSHRCKIWNLFKRRHLRSKSWGWEMEWSIKKLCVAWLLCVKWASPFFVLKFWYNDSVIKIWDKKKIANEHSKGQHKQIFFMLYKMGGVSPIRGRKGWLSPFGGLRGDILFGLQDVLQLNNIVYFLPIGLCSAGIRWCVVKWWTHHHFTTLIYAAASISK